jgi:diguanylate cyclase
MKQDWLDVFLLSGEQTRQIDHARRLSTLRFVNYFVVIVLFIFSVVYITGPPSTLKVTLWLSFVFALLNTLYVSATHHTPRAALSSFIVFTGIIFALALSGGDEGTALYWLYAYPPIIYLVTNSRAGIFMCALVFLGLAALLSLDVFAIEHYSTKEISRFLMSWMFVSFVLFINEHFNNQSFRDLSHINEEKQMQANTDPLTLLPNRRFMDSVYFPFLSRAPLKNLPLTLAIADIDHFKSVNDRLGHDKGDDVLCQVARLMQQQLRSSDVVVRMGGEEFLIALPGTDIDDGQIVIEGIREAIEAACILPEGTGQVTMSFGVTTLTDLGAVTSAIKQADLAMYQAKSDGRNRVGRFAPEPKPH